MDTITWDDKITGDSFTAAEATEIKTVVNANAADTYNDLVVPILNVKLPASDAPTEVTVHGGKAYAFDVGDYVYFNMQLPHAYKEGSDVNIHFHFSPSSAVDSETSKSLNFTLSYNWANVNGEFAGTASTLTTGKTLTGVKTTEHLIYDMGNLTGTGKTISSIIVCKLERVAAIGGYSGTINVLSIDAHIRQDAIGSSTSTSK